MCHTTTAGDSFMVNLSLPAREPAEHFFRPEPQQSLEPTQHEPSLSIGVCCRKSLLFLFQNTALAVEAASARVILLVEEQFAIPYQPNAS